VEKERRILWIEDDYHVVKGLLRPLEKIGVQIDVATSALDGYRMLTKQQRYDLIVVDLILPLTDDTWPPPKIVAAWQDERHAGVGLLKWLMQDLKVECPVLVLSVVQDPIPTFDLGDLGIAGSLLKRGLLPSAVKEEVSRLLGIE
jgi:CheY-like chemotaxis protein